jgi:hypothetical protein
LLHRFNGLEQELVSGESLSRPPEEEQENASSFITVELVSSNLERQASSQSAPTILGAATACDLGLEDS